MDGSFALFGIIVGLVAGIAARKKVFVYGGTVGAVCFALGHISDVTFSPTWQWAVASLITGLYGAIEGFIWCGIWGLAGQGIGSMFGKNSRAPQEQLRGIFLYREGQQYGPYPMDAITEWYRSGKLSRNDLAFNGNSNQWIPLSAFFGANNPTFPSSTSSSDEELAHLDEKGTIPNPAYEESLPESDVAIERKP